MTTRADRLKEYELEMEVVGRAIGVKNYYDLMKPNSHLSEFELGLKSSVQKLIDFLKQRERDVGYEQQRQKKPDY